MMADVRAEGEAMAAAKAEAEARAAQLAARLSAAVAELEAAKVGGGCAAQHDEREAACQHLLGNRSSQVACCEWPNSSSWPVPCSPLHTGHRHSWRRCGQAGVLLVVSAWQPLWCIDERCCARFGPPRLTVISLTHLPDCAPSL